MEPLQHKPKENAAMAKHDEKIRNLFKPTAAFIATSWFALLAGAPEYCVVL